MPWYFGLMGLFFNDFRINFHTVYHILHYAIICKFSIACCILHCGMMMRLRNKNRDLDFVIDFGNNAMNIK